MFSDRLALDVEIVVTADSRALSRVALSLPLPRLADGLALRRVSGLASMKSGFAVCLRMGFAPSPIAAHSGS